jgi:phospholipid/cholesterol/gamma-HCH transport system substrate-binding protein
VTRSLTRRQSAVLGLVVVVCLAVGVWGLFRVSGNSGLWSDGYELTVLAADAQDVEKGTPVRVRGLQAGQVVGVEDAGDGVRIRLRLDDKYRDRLYADATALVQTKGLLGVSVVDVKPGTSGAGPLRETVVYAKPAPDLAEVTAKLNSVAGRVDSVLKEVQEGNGSLPKLLRDETVYNDLKATTADARRLARNLDETVTAMRGDAQRTLTKVDSGVDAIHGELGELRGLVRTGKDAATAIKQDAEAIKSLPIVRSYIQDHVAALVRPECSKDRVVYRPEDIFEPGTSVLTDVGRNHLNECAGWLRGQKQKGSEVVVAAFVDPNATEQTSASASALTKKQAETVAEYFRGQGVHKMGWVARRDVKAIGLGQDPSPVVEKEALPAERIEIILFVPR